jgi:DNA-binding MarR family transcriptional regulator
MGLKTDPPRPTWTEQWHVDAKVENIVLRDYAQIQYHFVEFILAHLADCSRVFGGDLQEMVVLGLVGQVFLQSFNQGKPLENQDDYAGINASRIADVLGIPRETVRRKLRSLSKRGWVVQTDDATWKLRIEDGDSVVRKELSDLDRRGLARMIKTALALRPLLENN